MAAVAHADSQEELESAVPSAPLVEPIAHVLDRIDSAEGADLEQAIAAALARPGETLAELIGRFPGRLRAERYAVAGRPLRAGQHGATLDLVLRLGPAAADLVAAKLRDESRDIRYYAALCALELRPVEALPALVERLFDVDHSTRAIAMEALAGYPIRELEGALDFARRAVHSDEANHVKAAADALARLADVGAIPDLLDALARGDSGSDAVRRALVSLTKQDFGTNTKKWRGWWGGQKSRSRIEWLLDGLGHKDAAIRQSSVEELRNLTGEYFGFHNDLSRREREQARQRWLTWWQDTGRQRYQRESDAERNRPTALLPRREGG